MGFPKGLASAVRGFKQVPRKRGGDGIEDEDAKRSLDERRDETSSLPPADIAALNQLADEMSWLQPHRKLKFYDFF